MRIGLVIYGSLDTLTGGYLYDRKLAEQLTAGGDDVEVVCLPWRNYGRHLCDNGSAALARRLERGGFDVLLQDELNHPSLVLTNRRLRARAGCPAIVAIVHVLRADEHARARLRPLYEAVERRYLAGLDGAVFCCAATRARAQRLAGARLRGLVALPGCDHVTVSPSRPPRDGPLRVVSVANVVPRKGLHVLVAALARLAPECWRLTVAGSLTMDPAYVRRVRRLIDDAGLAGNVELAGVVPNADVPAVLAAGDVLVVPSAYEGLAIAYVEAMRCGLPVIATSAGGAGEIVEHGREGWLLEPGDVAGLTGHLSLLARDRALLQRMSLAARRRAASHPTWEETFAGTRAFLHAIGARQPAEAAA